MWYAHDGMGLWMLFGGVFWLILIATIAWMGFQLAHRDPGAEVDALQQAKVRYARGEISRNEFRRIAHDLTHPLSQGGRDAGASG